MVRRQQGGQRPGPRRDCCSRTTGPCRLDVLCDGGAGPACLVRGMTYTGASLEKDLSLASTTIVAHGYVVDGRDAAPEVPVNIESRTQDARETDRCP